MGSIVTGRFEELEEALVERLRELRGLSRLAPVTVVVGSGALRTRLLDSMIRRLGAIANVRVLTLAQLASWLAAQANGAPSKPLVPLARERLLRRLAGERADRGELFYFGPVHERPHFAQALAATFGDLRQARVPAIALGGGVAAEAGGGRASETKPADLAGLYEAYCARLEENGLGDDAAVHLAAAGVARAGLQTAATAPTQFIVYGLYDLNEAQEALLAALLASGADVFVPQPRMANGGQAPPVLSAARAAGLPERHLEAPDLWRDADRVAEAARGRRADPAGRLPLEGDGSLSVVSVPDERAESREAVREILAALQGGAAAWDCAVIVPHGDDVERLAAALRAAGLPVAARLPDRSPGARALGRLLDCLAPPAGERFSRRAVLDLFAVAGALALQAGQAPAALWADEARQAGVVAGLEQWTERLSRRRRGLGRRLDELSPAGAAEDWDEQGGDRLELMQRRLDAAQALEEAARMLAGAVAALPDRAGWAGWAEAFGGLAEALFEPKTAAGVHDACAGLAALDALDETVDVREAAALLREQLSGSAVQLGRIGRDGVAVLTPLQARGLSFHTIAFAGLAEGGFPSRGRPDPILGDAARRALSEKLGVRLPGSEAREDEALLLFAFACEAARERLVLLAPRTEAASGKPRLPSRLLLRLASLAAGRPVGMDEFLAGGPLRPVWRRVAGADGDTAGAGAVWVEPRERDAATLRALAAAGGSAAAAPYLAAALADPAAPSYPAPALADAAGMPDPAAALANAAGMPDPTVAPADAAAAGRRIGQWQAGRSPEPGPWDGLLGEAARSALLAHHPLGDEMHPTRLERYVDCPFAFYLRDVLGLDTPEEPEESLEMDAREFGILAHEILQRTYAAVIAQGLDRAAALDEVKTAWELSCGEAERRGVTGVALAWQVRRAALLADLTRLITRDPVFNVPGECPLVVEWRFGAAHDRPVELDLPDGRRVRFAGRLDRVDETGGGARVIDYKTGAGRTEEERLKAGLSVQLPVYRLAVRQAAGIGDGPVACLYRYVTRRGGLADIPLAGTEEAGDERLRGLVAAVLGRIDAGVFPRTTRGRCDFCEMGYACGVSSWTRARKRAHEGLADVVALQSKPPKAGG